MFHVSMAAISIAFAALRFILPFTGDLNRRHVFRDVLHLQIGLVFGFALAHQSMPMFWTALCLLIVVQYKIVFTNPFNHLDAYKNGAHLFIGILFGFAFLAGDLVIGLFAGVLVSIEVVAFLMSVWNREPSRLSKPAAGLNDAGENPRKSAQIRHVFR